MLEQKLPPQPRWPHQQQLFLLSQHQRYPSKLFHHLNQDFAIVSRPEVRIVLRAVSDGRGRLTTILGAEEQPPGPRVATTPMIKYFTRFLLIGGHRR